MELVFAVGALMLLAQRGERPDSRVPPLPSGGGSVPAVPLKEGGKGGKGLGSSPLQAGLQAVEMTVEAAMDLGNRLVGKGGDAGAVGAMAGQNILRFSGAGLMPGLGPTPISFDPISAQAGNVGRLLGKELDKLLGGDGVTGSGVVNQVTGYIAGLLVAAYGVYAIPFVGQLVAIVAGIAAAVNDGVRLAHGQPGAVNDAKTVANDQFIGAKAAMREQALSHFGVSELSPEDERTLVAHACAFAKGFAKAENAAKVRGWMKRPHLGHSELSWTKHGGDRGWFVRDFNWHEVEAFVDQWLPPGTHQATPEGLARTAAMGATACNVANYLAWMNEPWGLNNAKAHALYGRDVNGAFEGYTDPSGNLLLGNSRVDHAASKQAGKPAIVGA